MSERMETVEGCPNCGLPMGGRWETTPHCRGSIWCRTITTLRRERDEAVADAKMVRADAQRKLDTAKRQRDDLLDKLHAEQGRLGQAQSERRTMLEALKRERDAYRAAQEDAGVTPEDRGHTTPSDRNLRIVQAAMDVSLDHTCTEFTPDEHDPTCPECRLAQLLNDHTTGG